VKAKKPVSRTLTRLRKICLSFPGATEKTSWGSPTFRGSKRIFAMYASKENHHGKGRDGVWVMAAPGRQERMVRTHPGRFFVPPYVGCMGWLGIWLDKDCDWDELVHILKAAHELAEGPPLPMPKKK
jgi:predicted DNA-binding protein (MmcQ/YjbR family)